VKNVVSALHWAHRFSQSLEDLRITPHSVDVNDRGSTFHLSYQDFLRVYTGTRWSRQPSVWARPIGRGVFRHGNSLQLRFMHGSVAVVTHTPTTSQPLIEVPDDGLSLGQWKPAEDPQPWVARGEQ
jgi:hypothetical protein